MSQTILSNCFHDCYFFLPCLICFTDGNRSNLTRLLEINKFYSFILKYFRIHPLRLRTLS